MSDPLESQAVRRERIQARKRQRLLERSRADPVQSATPPFDLVDVAGTAAAAPAPAAPAPRREGPRKHRWESRQSDFEQNLLGLAPEAQATLRQHMSRILDLGRTLAQKRRENRDSKAALQPSPEKITIESFMDQARSRIISIEEHVADIFKDTLRGVVPADPMGDIGRINRQLHELTIFEQQSSTKIFELQDTRRRIERQRLIAPRRPYTPRDARGFDFDNPDAGYEDPTAAARFFGGLPPPTAQHTPLEFPGRPDMGPENFGTQNQGTWNEQDIEQLIDHTHTEIPSVDMPPQMNISILEHQRQGLAWLLHQESSANKGGILADDMGLGKTVQTIALIYANPAGDDVPEKDAATLIVCPLALIQTWVSDLSERVHPEHRVDVYVHHPRHNTPTQSMASVCRNHKVVVTTYETLAGEFKSFGQDRIRRRPLYDVKWHRIVLDEAHLIKNHKSIRSMATERLQSTYRLCLSGTPMQNNLVELWPLLRFLRIKPYWDKLGEFRKILPQKEMEARNMSRADRDERWNKLHVLLASILLRRTKDTEINGAKILASLPSKTSFDIKLVMNEKEKESYSNYENGIKERARSFMDEDDGDAFTSMLVLLLRLRQRSCHPYLPKITSKPWKLVPTSVPDKVVERARDLSPAAIVIAMGETKEEVKDETESPTTTDDRTCVSCSENFDKNTIMILDPCGHSICPLCLKSLHSSANTNESSDIHKCPKCQVLVQTEGIPLSLLELVQMNRSSSNEEIQDLYASMQRAKRQIIRDAENLQASRLDSFREELQSTRRMDFTEFDEHEDDDVDVDTGDEAEPENKDIKPSDSVVALADDPVASTSAVRDDKSFYFRRGIFSGQGGAPDRFGSIHIGLASDKLHTIGRRYEQSEIDQVARLFYRSTCFREGWVESTKCSAVVETLFDIWTEAPSDKVIIFSFFTSFLDVLTIPLDAARIKYVTYTGELDIEERNEALKQFAEGEEKVLLISLKAGNVGLTLTAANRVFIVEPFWNPYVEDQAQDRVYRIGQHKKVKVYRFICGGTVEERITELQETKRSLIESALDKNARENVMSLTREAVGYLLGLRRNHGQPRITEEG